MTGGIRFIRRRTIAQGFLARRLGLPHISDENKCLFVLIGCEIFLRKVAEGQHLAGDTMDAIITVGMVDDVRKYFFKGHSAVRYNLIG